ncbi:hypothetical protein M5689_010914 [Euphorbia peplus]|nr:hypothetical protein M5689_010914 [Euphorbia peplus]
MISKVVSGLVFIATVSQGLKGSVSCNRSLTGPAVNPRQNDGRRLLGVSRIWSLTYELRFLSSYSLDSNPKLTRVSWFGRFSSIP